jgi:hypothetical protein
MYAEFATDPKVQSMSEPMQRRLAMLFCLQCTGDLEKLDDEELALALRITPKDLERTRETFRRKGFIEEGWGLKNWRKRQAPSDPTARERMRNYRERHRNVTRNVTDDVTGDKRNVTKALRVDIEVEVEEEEKEKTPLNPPRGEKANGFALPDWIPRQDWEAFVEMRKKIGKKLTDAAKPLAVKKLERLRADGNDPGEVLRQSVLASWQGLFEVKEKDRAAPAAARPVERAYVTATEEHIHPKFRKQA